MNDTRTVGQEIQDQVLAAARKGQQRVANTVKNVTATAQLIRPQLPSLPRPTLNTSGLPTPAQIREKAPQLVAMLPSTEQLRVGAHEFAGQLLTVQRKVVEHVRSVTTPLAQQAEAHDLAGQLLTDQRKVVEQVRSVTPPLAQQAEAHDLAGQLLTVQRKVVEQVRSVTTPLAHQAAAVLGQVGKATQKATPMAAAISEDADHEHGKAGQRTAEHGKPEHGKPEHDGAEHGNGAQAKATGQHNGASATGRKPSTRKSGSKPAAK